MRVDRDHLVNGFVAYMENEVIPKISDDKAAQILISVWVKSMRTNQKLIDSILEQSFVKALLDKDDDGTYEIEGLFRNLRESVAKYGSFPITIPPIPLISPTEKTMKFDGNDISDLQNRIERGE